MDTLDNELKHVIRCIAKKIVEKNQPKWDKDGMSDLGMKLTSQTSRNRPTLASALLGASRQDPNKREWKSTWLAHCLARRTNLAGAPRQAFLRVNLILWDKLFSTAINTTLGRLYGGWSLFEQTYIGVEILPLPFFSS